MFCYQCEQTSKGAGCIDIGVCGKNEATAVLQDLLLHATEGVAQYAHRARQLGAKDREIDVFVLEALFTTVTNVNFDEDRVETMIRKAAEMKRRARTLYEDAAARAGKQPESLTGPAGWEPAVDQNGLLEQGRGVAITVRQKKYGEDLAGLQELLTYGLKGLAAYYYHAHVLGQDDDNLYGAIHESLSFVAREDPTVEGLLTECLKAGEMNLRAMELLDGANTGNYGHPVPTPVRTEPVKGKAICISGHDLKDLEVLLQQTEGKGINIYTHGEMLPAHGYPELKKYKHLVGNYGGAWMRQGAEFDAFPGAILMTTNCIQEPRVTYKDRIFTCGLVAWPGVRHITDRDFTPVIEAALAAPGFSEDGPDTTITVGFARNTVMSVADKVIEAVKAGAVKHFFLVGGCDGAKVGRNYFTDFTESAPDDTVILTLGCGKYRFNKIDFGDIGGIPRLLDMGQCNDAYSAIQVAVALSKAFDCGVNDLPLSLVVSWYEQKAVAVLLTLLHLGIRNIRLGPTLPAFVTPAVLSVLVNEFNVMPITTAEADLKAILN